MSYVVMYILMSLSSNEEDPSGHQHSKLNNGVTTKDIRLYPASNGKSQALWKNDRARTDIKKCLWI